MNLVVDTNVLFSALYDPSSVPGRVIELALEREVTLFAPESVLRELERTLRGKLGYTDEQWSSTRSAIPVEWIEPEVYEPGLATAGSAISDPDDVPVIATALVVDAPVLSGDGDFHPLEEPVVETLRPRETIEEISGG